MATAMQPRMSHLRRNVPRVASTAAPHRLLRPVPFSSSHTGTPRWLTRSQDQDSSSPSVTTEAAQPEASTSSPAADSSSTSSPKRKARQADSTDAVASFLSRRFGIAGGLAWLGILAVGSLGEQVKTRIEYSEELKNTREVDDAKEVVLPNGLRYTDLKLGGGSAPIKGYLMVVDYVAKADGVVFEDTRQRGKPIVYLYGSRPFTGGMCAGVEQALAGMKGGGKRRVIVPPELGFGDKGFTLRPTEHVPEKQGVIPPGATLEYEVELLRVSIPPS